MTKKILTSFVALVLCGLVVAGCDPAKQPAGMSEQDAKQAIDNMAPEDKIRAIASSPMPEAQKQERYKQIEQETGVKAADVLGRGGAGTPKGR